MAKRAEIAESIREDAQSMEGINKALRLFESLIYLEDAQARAEAEKLAHAYLDQFAAAPSSEKESYRGQMLELDRALQYLKKYQFIEDNNELLKTVDQLTRERGWKKR